MPVGLCPPLIGVGDLIEGCNVHCPVRVYRRQRRPGGDCHEAENSLGIRRREMEHPPDVAEDDEHRLFCARGVHHRQHVGDNFLIAVRLGRPWSIGAAVPPSVEGEDAKVAREIWNLCLPLLRVNDWRTRHEQNRRLALPEQLVVGLDALSLHVAFLIRIPRSHRGSFLSPRRVVTRLLVPVRLFLQPEGTPGTRMAADRPA